MMVDLLLGVLLAERQTQRAVRDLVRAADGEQNVARIERAGRARAAGGGADALLVKQEQQALALDALKAEVHVAGKTLRRVAVERRCAEWSWSPAMSLSRRALTYAAFFSMIRARLGKRRRHADDAGDIFRTGTFAALLRAALDQRSSAGMPRRAYSTPTPFGPWNLCAEMESISMFSAFTSMAQMARRLHRVRVEQHALFAADRADLRDGLDGADLVVGVHDRHKAGILADSVRAPARA